MTHLDAAFVQQSFVACLSAASVSAWLMSAGAKGTGKDASATKEFKRFQRTYLLVYLTATFSDWLQGPYLYAIYESYGISAGDNAILCMVGFGSSMVFGTVFASWADRIGRRKAAMLYCISYIVHNATKHFNWYGVLVLGRIFGGISISLLFSVFDAWLVCEHHHRCFDPELLSSTFSLAGGLNAVGAILAGIVAQVAADGTGGGSTFYAAFPTLSTEVVKTIEVHTGGYCAPFDVSSVILLGNVFLLRSLWTENYGTTVSDSAPTAKSTEAHMPKKGAAAVLELVMTEVDSMRSGLKSVLADRSILCCGIVCALFEAAMFIFIFQWTPAITIEGYPEPPYGTVFACFMVPCMIGSKVFDILSITRSCVAIGKMTLFVAAITHAVPVVTGDAKLRFLAFLVFEFTVGVYFPMIGTMKGNLVPDAARATVYSIFRVPLNFAVIVVLGNRCPVVPSFLLTCLMLLVACIAQRQIHEEDASGKATHLDVELSPTVLSGRSPSATTLGGRLSPTASSAVELRVGPAIVDAELAH